MIKDLGSFLISAKPNPEKVKSLSSTELILGNILLGCCMGAGLILGIAAGISILEVLL